MNPSSWNLGHFRLFPESASTFCLQYDLLFWFITAVTVFFSLLVAGMLLVFMIRFRRKSDDEVPEGIHGSLALEVGWSALPFLLTMIMFFWGASIYANIRRPPDDALQVNVVGKQWMWKAQHMEGRREINELHIPVGRPVRVTLTSEDVIHSFYVPAFRTKQDAVPGRYTTTWFEATKPGEYHLFCAEYCGTIHSGMIGRIVAMEPAAFQSWLTGQEPGVPDLPPAVVGRQLFEQQGCATCHSGQPGARGPRLNGVYGSKQALAGGGQVVADDAYIRESILNPQAKVVAGFQPVMPTYQGLLSEENVMQLLAYVKTLAAEQQGGTHE
jgi:cytochrome c oxidase subunit 2